MPQNKDRKELQDTSLQMIKAENHIARAINNPDLGLVEMLDRFMDVLLSLPWLKVEKKGGVFLVEDGQNDVLKLYSSKHLSPELHKLCDRVAFGHCLCGRAAATKTILHASCVDARHDTRFEGMQPHGHYNVPIMSGKKVLGVIVLYLEHGTQKRQQDIEFLERISNFLAPSIIKKKVERDLVRSNQELENFAHVVSHDLHEPLRMVASFTELLKEELSNKLNPTEQEYFDYVLRGANRAQKMVNDLLEYSRLGHGRPNIENVDMNSVVQSAQESLHGQIQETDAQITVSRLPNVKGNEIELIRVMQNLLSNAMKYKKPGVKPQIEISAQTGDHDGTTIKIKDNGPGIRPDLLEKIFLPLKRHDETGQVEGTGMGLAICRRLIERMHGTIRAVSRPGCGACFDIKLPSGDTQEKHIQHP